MSEIIKLIIRKQTGLNYHKTLLIFRRLKHIMMKLQNFHTETFNILRTNTV